MIRGPVGEQRLDENFAWLRQTLLACHGNKYTIEECRLKYNYKGCFPKDVADAIEEMVANADAEMESIINRFGGKR